MVKKSVVGSQVISARTATHSVAVQELLRYKHLND